MTSPTKSFEQLQVSKTRERRDTTSLLPSTYDLDADVMPECPVPEANMGLYTPDRLQQSLVYAHKFLARRNISPRAELFMQLYKDELKDALNAETTKEREISLRLVIVEEKLVQEKDFLKPLDSQSEELQDHLLKLRELEYFMRYGDYIQIIPTRIRLYTSKNKTENWELLLGQNYWSNIAKELDAEEEGRQATRFRTGSILDHPNLRVTYAVSRACQELGISEEMVVRSIMEYGRRNNFVHLNLADLRKEGDFHLLAKILYTDREGLSLIFSEVTSETDLARLRDIIQNEIDTWFNTSVNPGLPTTWCPTEALIQAYCGFQQLLSTYKSTI
ncbi:MAG: hypothetical protein Q9163_002963 [Psora crenata]